jgi:hypothetical protein
MYYMIREIPRNEVTRRGIVIIPYNDYDLDRGLI